MPQERKTRGGGGGEKLPPLDEALSSEEGHGTYSYGYRSVDRDANNLPRPNRYNKRGDKAKFHKSLDEHDGVDSLEPPAEGKYSSSTSGFDKYAKSRSSSSKHESSHHSSSHHRTSSSGHHDDSTKHSSSKHSSSKHSSSSTCKDPKGKGKYKRDEDDDYGGSTRAFGGLKSGAYYGGSAGSYSSSSGGYYGSSY